MITKHERVCAIVPAYNEAGRIGQVLAVLREVERLSEIVVVDDGSEDGTGLLAEAAAQQDSRLRVIHHKTNQGKGQAIWTGRSCTQARCLLTLDADLVGLTPTQVEALIEPVANGSADMTLGLFHHGAFRTDIAHRMTPWLTGQRCFRRDLLDRVSFRAAAGYGFETALSIAAHQGGWRCRRVALEGVTHPPSELHRGALRGLWTRARMYAQIVRALFQALGWKKAVRFIREGN